MNLDPSFEDPTAEGPTQDEPAARTPDGGAADGSAPGGDTGPDPRASGGSPPDPEEDGGEGDGEIDHDDPTTYFSAEELEGSGVADLVDLAQQGEVEALNELFSRYYQQLVDVARRRLGPRLRGKEEADDLAQTTFREATRDFPRYRYRGEGSLLRWLFQILNNKIRDRAEFYSAGKRDIGRERAIETAGGSSQEPKRLEPPSADLSVTRQVSREEEFSILRSGLERLSPEHRQAITLVFFQGLTLREAGERMEGRSEDAVRMMLRRAEARLRDIVSGKLGDKG